MVGGRGIAENHQHARVLDVGVRTRLAVEILEVRRFFDVGRSVVPRVEFARTRGDLSPSFGAFGGRGVLRFEHLPLDGALDDRADLVVGRPHILEIDRFSVLILAERLVDEVGRHRSGDGVGDDQRRRGQVVRPHMRADAAFEVPVAREHRGRDKILVLDCLLDRLGQGSGVADAGGAAVADQVEAERLEGFEQAGFL